MWFFLFDEHYSLEYYARNFPKQNTDTNGFNLSYNEQNLNQLISMRKYFEEKERGVCMTL